MAQTFCHAPYVLFTRIPFTRDNAGRIYCDPLWAKDLKLHLGYVQNLGICCPVENREKTAGLEDITDLGIKSIFELKRDYGLKSVLINWSPNFVAVIKACKQAEIVHSGGAGWAFPLSFYLLALRPFFDFKWVIVIESSFWMLEQGERKTVRKVISHFIHKVFLKKCLRSADARVFTQSFYRKYFLGDETASTLINPATWVDEKVISTPANVRRRFQENSDGILKIICPSRLTEEKGILVVLEAVKQLHVAKRSIRITLIGSGRLQEKCQGFVGSYQGNVEVEFKSQISYGAEFFELLGRYDFVLAPTLKQEQPRIIFDAFSQGVPIIGADTPGIRDITDKTNAVIFKRGCPDSLAEVIGRILTNPQDRLEMGLAALEYARGKTHLQMHKDRSEFLHHVL